MALARTTVYVPENCALEGRALVRDSGDVCAWLDVGGFEVGVWGSPSALRRLAAAVSAAADQGDRLAERERDVDRGVSAAL